MQKKKLYRYFSRLQVLEVSVIHEITLPEIAQLLLTSERYARTLMKQFQDSQWVSWTPKVGRNQRSLMQIEMTLDDAQHQVASELIEKGQYEAAREMVDHNDRRFAQLLESTSGAVIREGMLHVQLTYRRQIMPLLPQMQQRNSERFLLRQLYACLVESDADGQLKPQLAHHWACLQYGLVWRFYIRPNLRFHDSSVINAYRLTALFNQLKMLPEYDKEMAHIQCISALSELVIEFKLHKEDRALAALFSDIRYSIQPEQQVGENIKQTGRLIGSGAFKLAEHNNEKLKLVAFDEFYACRALTDSVTIWQLNEESNALPCDITINQNCLVNLGVNKQEQNNSVSSEISEPILQDQARVEDGCLLMIFNQRGKAISSAQVNVLSNILNWHKLPEQLNKIPLAGFVDQKWAIPARHLLPQWPNVHVVNSEMTALPEHVSIAIFEHQALVLCAEQIQRALIREGVDCRIDKYDFNTFNHKLAAGELNHTILLSSINLDDNRPTSLFRWLYSSSLLQQCLSEKNKAWLDRELTQIRERLPASDYLPEIEPLVSAMIQGRWIQPLFHHKQAVHFQGVLKGVEISTWGWPLLKDVWQAS